MPSRMSFGIDGNVVCLLGVCGRLAGCGSLVGFGCDLSSWREM